MGFHELVDRIRRLVKTDWLREAREVVITKKGKGADVSDTLDAACHFTTITS